MDEKAFWRNLKRLARSPDLNGLESFLLLKDSQWTNAISTCGHWQQCISLVLASGKLLRLLECFPITAQNLLNQVCSAATYRAVTGQLKIASNMAGIPPEFDQNFLDAIFQAYTYQHLFDVDLLNLLTHMALRAGLVMPNLGTEIRRLTNFPVSHWETVPTSLQPNIIEGPFPSKSEYLATQGTLLKEDFLIPLRLGMEELRSGGISHKCHDYFYLYGVVSFSRLECIPHQGLRVHLCSSVMEKKSSPSTGSSERRLLPGSLVILMGLPLCRSSTIIMGVVQTFASSHRVPTNDPGNVCLSLLSSNDLAEFNQETQFHLFEFKVYLEAYQHTLRVLEEQTLNAKFDSYLINPSSRNICPLPYFSTNQEQTVRIDDLLNTQPLARKELLEVSELFKMLWSKPESQVPINATTCTMSESSLLAANSVPPYDIQLNSSQFEGFQSIFRQNLSLIQGPPGTGKSFMGKTILAFLHHNRLLWCKSNHSPILVMAYTNQALDIFLEDVLSITTQVIRLGSRSSSPRMELHSLPALRNYAKTQSLQNHSFYMRQKELKCQSREIYEQLLVLIETLNQTMKDENFLKEEFILEHQVQINYPEDQDVQFPISYEWGSGEIKEWLRDQSIPLSKSGPWSIAPNLRRSSFERSKVCFQTRLRLRIEEILERYTQMIQEIKEIQHFEDIEILQRAHVIGVTISGASKHKRLLEYVGNEIVIVEESAQILEPQLLAALPTSTSQLIMIGDHQQLRPSTSTHEMARKYRLNVSLFERLIKNGYPHQCLQEQHRMRPEISRVLRELFFTNLSDHHYVTQSPNIRGVSSNLLFFTHSDLENPSGTSTSHSNLFEAEFLSLLVQYLLIMGYEASKITVLTMYTSQMMLIKETLLRYTSKSPMDLVEVAVVDNFQGNENEIILLSLVRSGSDGIGFLGEINRICVALSRAQHGLFIIGNARLLEQKSDTWSKILDHLTREGRVVDVLTLFCPNHPVVQLNVSSLDSFKAALAQRCPRPCGQKQAFCGHKCERPCHLLDPFHRSSDLACQRLCDRECSEGHPCERACSQPCHPCHFIDVVILDGCGHKNWYPCLSLKQSRSCQQPMRSQQPCGHIINTLCSSTNPEPCQEPCGFELQCGHACQEACHWAEASSHTYKCLEACEKLNLNCRYEHKCARLCFQDCEPCQIPMLVNQLPCGHGGVEVPCTTDLELYECTLKCQRRRAPCGHPCRNFCYECQPTAECPPCKSVDIFALKCGHSRKLFCHEVGQYSCDQPCERTLSCGHSCPLTCGQPCHTARCKVAVNSPISAVNPPRCRHANAQLPCSLANENNSTSGQVVTVSCQEICGTKLSHCPHFCGRKCNECLPSEMIHLPCSEKCERFLVCGHKCESQCGIPCPPCRQKCQIRCRHAACQAKCGDPCKIPCQLKCDFQCPHVKCRKKCAQRDGHKLCYEPCSLSLPCGHGCRGLCGAPCPEFCLKCEDQSTSDDNLNVTVLLDCGHVVLSGSLRSNPNSGRIGFLMCCTECGQTVSSPSHGLLIEMERIKTAMCEVMDRIFEFNTTLHKLRTRIVQKLHDMPNEDLKRFVNNRLGDTSSPVSATEASVILGKIRILSEIPQSHAHLGDRVGRWFLQFDVCRDEFLDCLLKWLRKQTTIASEGMNTRILSCDAEYWDSKKPIWDQSRAPS